MDAFEENGAEGLTTRRCVIRITTEIPRWPNILDMGEQEMLCLETFNKVTICLNLTLDFYASNGPNKLLVRKEVSNLNPNCPL